MTNYIIFDSGSLINITQNGLNEVLKELAKIFPGEFLITPEVEYEIITHPLKIKKFEWGALRMNKLLEEGTIKLSDKMISRELLDKKTQEIMHKINNSFTSEGKQIHLIDKGEGESLALSILLKEKNLKNAVAIDERTARMLCENPETLRELMQNKLHKKIRVDFNTIKILQDIKIIRSTELMYIANKHNLLDKDRRTIEAVLYALKFGGCSISEREIETMKTL